MQEKTVLWVSRHEMTAAQMDDLARVAGGPVRLLPYCGTVRDPAELAPLAAEADIVAAVLPLELMARLKALLGETPLIQAVSERRLTGRTRTLPDGRTEPEAEFVHRCWQRIDRIEVSTTVL